MRHSHADTVEGYKTVMVCAEGEVDALPFI